MVLLVTRLACPSFSQLPRHVQDQYRDTDAEVEAYRRGTAHAVVQFALLTIAGIGLSLLVQRNTTRRIKTESNQPSQSIAGKPGSG
jgi:hypothetical protein